MLKASHRATSPQGTHYAGLDDGSPDQLLLMDDQTMEQVDNFQLDTQEAACSMCSVTFADDPTEYFAVGTAYVLPEEPEPTKVNNQLFSFV